MLISQPVFHQTLAMTPVLLASFMIGINLGWLPPILKKYTNAKGDFSLTDTECSWMVSLQYLGHLAGCVIVIFMVDRFGRNAVIILAEVTTMLSMIGVALTKSAILHLLIRFLTGVSMGLIIPILSIYIGENSSPAIRGVFGSSSSLFLYGGILVGCSIPTYCSYEIASYILVAMSLVNLSSAVLLREPAQYLLAKGCAAEAENQFFWLRGKDEKTQTEFNDVKSNLTIEKPKFSPSVLTDRYFLIACTIAVLIYFTGFPAVAPLVSVMLVPTQQLSTNELTVLSELFQLVGAFVSPFIIDRFRRRTLWIVSAALIAILHFLTATLFLAREKGIEVPNEAWLLWASISAYTAIFSCAMYPLNILARTELLTQKLRTIGSSTSSILNGLTCFIVGHVYFHITLNFGIQTNFIGYGIFSLMILVFSYFYIPETRGKSLIEIEKILAKPVKKNDHCLSRPHQLRAYVVKLESNIQSPTFSPRIY